MKPTKIFLSMLAMMTFSFWACGDDNCQAEVIADCVCTQEYDPVCGCDGRTYSNDCAAECSGITDYFPGECN